MQALACLTMTIIQYDMTKAILRDLQVIIESVKKDLIHSWCDINTLVRSDCIKYMLQSLNTSMHPLNSLVSSNGIQAVG